ncbi:MAG: DUF995 domain-containing protein [Gammaproteobacteria bacterium]|nr:DUF995 domain-containing protein [Gammaproteobacteria bacterium]
MKYIPRVSSIILISAITLAGCQTGGNSIELGADATPLSMGELYNYFADQTQVRGDGGVYYSDYGTLVALEGGERAEGTWASYDGGKLCRILEGHEDSCETYYHHGDEIAMEAAGKVTLAPKKMEGDQIELLATGTARKLFTRDETIALVSGKTHDWGDHNGAYYAADFKLETIWDGAKEGGKWSVTDEGALCWHVPSWGSGPCESYFMGADGLMSVYKGEEGEASELLEGNVLNEL